VLFSSAFPGMFGGSCEEFSAPTTACSPRRWTSRSWSRRGLGDLAEGGLYGVAPLLVAIIFGLDPAWGMCSSR